MKIRLVLIIAALFFSLSLKAFALSDKELTDIGQILAAEPGGHEDVETKVSGILYQQGTEQNTNPETDKVSSPIEIFYRLGLKKDGVSPLSDPLEIERQIRQRDQLINELFDKEKGNE